MFKLVWFGPALSNQVYGSRYDTPGSFRRVNNVSSSLTQCFHERGELSRADDLAHAARFLSNAISRCSYNLIKEFRSLFTG